MTLLDGFCCLRRLWLLVPGMVLLCGCATDSARPGTVCGHCDYRFSYQTPNPCDPCVRVVELPCFGYTPTSWQLWPEGCAYSPYQPAPQELPIEAVPLPETMPPTPLPSAQDASRHPDSVRRNHIAISG